jgi:hypothetical protein
VRGTQHRSVGHQVLQLRGTDPRGPGTKSTVRGKKFRGDFDASHAPILKPAVVARMWAHARPETNGVPRCAGLGPAGYAKNGQPGEVGVT